MGGRGEEVRREGGLSMPHRLRPASSATRPSSTARARRASQADIGVRGGQIVPHRRASTEASAKTGASTPPAGSSRPGFIDAHTHDDRLMLSAPDMAPKVSQGVTTVVAGNCGISLAPAPQRHAGAGHAAARSARRRGRLVPLPDLRDYVAALKAQARPRPTARCWSATPCCASQTMDDVRPARQPRRRSAQMRAMVRRGAGGRRDRRVDRASTTSRRAPRRPRR